MHRASRPVSQPTDWLASQLDVRLAGFLVVLLACQQVIKPTGKHDAMLTSQLVSHPASKQDSMPTTRQDGRLSCRVAFMLSCLLAILPTG